MPVAIVPTPARSQRYDAERLCIVLPVIVRELRRQRVDINEKRNARRQRSRPIHSFVHMLLSVHILRQPHT